MAEWQQVPELHPLLASRWSPTVFDETHQASPADVEVLLEAARWAPSAGNSQPWAFIVGRRGDPTHRRMVRYLARSSAAWAPTAGLLVANLAHRLVEDTDWEFSEFASYDLGQAVAHMTFQAAALGLSVRQFRAFDRAGLAAEFSVPAHWEVSTMAAVGRIPPAVARLDPDRAGPPSRNRHATDDIRWPTG
jgi:nitroreductase